MSEALLIFGDTERSPALRHEVPLAVGDPFLWALVADRPAAVLNVLELDRVVAVVPEIEALTPEALGADELIAAGAGYDAVQLELSARAVARLGIRAAAVPSTFPVGLADRLRADGVELRVDQPLFDERRRAKNPAELAGIIRAQRAAEAAMAVAAGMLREAGDGTLTAEQLRAAIRSTCAEHGAPAPADIIVAPGAQAAAGHEPGSGPLPARTPIDIDLWPRDEASGCWADMTRTFVIGEPTPEALAQHALVMAALARARAAVRPGIAGRDAYAAACEVFEAAGHPTQRTKAAGEILRDGFFFGLGHGVGLEVHESPSLGRAGVEAIVAGDVLALEPGTYDRERGGVRVEDLVLVTELGCETLTDYPYELTP